MKIMGFNLSWSLFDIDTTHNYTECVEFVDYDISINLEFEDIYIYMVTWTESSGEHSDCNFFSLQHQLHMQ